jgi:putative transposase
LIQEHGKPSMVVSDNGSELTSNATLRWADDSRVAWHYIAPGIAGHVPDTLTQKVPGIQ